MFEQGVIISTEHTAQFNFDSKFFISGQAIENVLDKMPDQWRQVMDSKYYIYIPAWDYVSKYADLSGLTDKQITSDLDIALYGHK